MADPQTWAPDILGAPFEQVTLPLGTDAEGEVMATLVRSRPRAAALKPLADVDVLYVHGWSDYFFQRSLARFLTDRGARFFALDLRKYGRSLRPGQTPGYIANLEDYDADTPTARALALMAARDGLDLPIAAMVARLAEGRVSVEKAMDHLLSRPLKEE